MDTYRVALESDERVALERLVSTGKAAARKLTHARILLLADDALGPGQTDDAIVCALGVSQRTIARVRQRFVTQGLAAAIDRKAQASRPGQVKIKGDVEQRLIQLACSDPPEGRCRWTLQLLCDEMVVLGLTDAISTETVRQSLKKTPSNPGSSTAGVSRPTPTRTMSGGWRT